jgi:peptide/nickel transport system permease protein
MVFSIQIGWFPTGGWVAWSSDAKESIRHLVLPSLTLGLGMGSVLARFVRTAIVDVMRQDYVRTGRAFGMSEYRALFTIGLRNASLPIVTVIGNIVSHLVGGTVITETLFSMPGLSRMLLDSVLLRDVLVVQNLVMILVVYILIVNLLVDLSYFALDKRLKIK